MDNLRFEDIEADGTVVFSLFLGPEFLHVGGSLHGGAATLILDQCTSLSIAPHAAPGYWEWTGGVTRTLSVTCLRAPPGHTTVKIRCKVISIGQTVVLVRGEIVSDDGKLVYDVLDHNKINVRLKPRAPGSKL
ncbi:uncharacterized protein A1O5_01335 [Cladophialophora psammophila CBS 110553]|uniref:Thioesterase domain-containing protein n=1 Tax=Cladophialophora psammophila CBS 110553 TaxID=1182543 RepID=W9X2D9_9EURO|nr:uncharacterized protein A1O5_01335 [Cladophialophora psammophila CBS 110553]EXJ74642.1 hypothetical protein A1O5_01335 [Cladophialophora psammophila CBS 110553]